MHREQLSYGPSAEQVVDLAWPSEGAEPLPVVVLIHGGFWRQAYGKDLMVPLARDAVIRGYATANVEYRRVGGAGGWPTTFEDVGAAVDALADADAPLDLDRLVVVGHSAGGHLAAWVGVAAERPGRRGRGRPACRRVCGGEPGRRRCAGALGPRGGRRRRDGRR